MLSYLGFLTLAGLAACGTNAGHAVSDAPQTTATSGATQISPVSSTTDVETATPKPRPKFAAKISHVSRDQVTYSWRASCPVSYKNLRMITMTHWGFDKQVHTGRLIVNESAAEDLVSVFHKLYDQHYPIKRMEPVDKYKGDDYRSIDADNTSAFNCRPATGSSNWSQHAYGLALDLNPLENPWVNADGTNAHRNADKYVKRPLHKPGVINANDHVVKAFAKIGWGWGGDWSGAKDYQHFSSTGR
jgi:hypothetical protein